MSQQLVVNPNSFNGELDDNAISTLITAGVLPRGTPTAQATVFAHICKEKGLSPFSKEIYLLNYGTTYTPIVGINGFRKIAARTGFLAGIDDAKFDLKSDGSFRFPSDYKLGEKPQSATVTVWKMVGNQKVSFTHTAVFVEFDTKQQKWVSMPFQMIAKVAESFAIRKGFAAETSGLSSDEEIGALTDSQPTIYSKPTEAIIEILSEKQQDEALKIHDDLCTLDFEQRAKFFAEKTEWHNEKHIVEVFLKLCESPQEIIVIGKNLINSLQEVQQLTRYYLDKARSNAN
jgi:phage recombination protein Bet